VNQIANDNQVSRTNQHKNKFKENNMTLDQIFKFARKSQNIKQSLVAKKAGIAQPSLANYESGRCTLSEKTLLKIAPTLNINPDYIKGDAANPFLSKDLIKMLISDKLLTGADYTPIEFIVRTNFALEIIFLTTTDRAKPFDKATSKTMSNQPTIAILIRDQDMNTFILRRKNPKAYLADKSDLKAKISQIIKEENKEAVCQEENKEIVFQTKVITRELFEKINGWTVTKKDVDKFFSLTQSMELTADEYEMLCQMRIKKIEPKALFIEILNGKNSCKTEIASLDNPLTVINAEGDKTLDDKHLRGNTAKEID